MLCPAPLSPGDAEHVTRGYFDVEAREGRPVCTRPPIRQIPDPDRRGTVRDVASVTERRIGGEAGADAGGIDEGVERIVDGERSRPFLGGELGEEDCRLHDVGSVADEAADEMRAAGEHGARLAERVKRRYSEQVVVEKLPSVL